jgi:hypothetical protein
MKTLKRAIILLVIVLVAIESYSIGLYKGMALQKQADRADLRQRIADEISFAYRTGKTYGALKCALEELNRENLNESGK